MADPTTDVSWRAWHRVRERGPLPRHQIARQHGAWDVVYLVEERDYGSEVIALRIVPHEIPLGPEMIPTQVANPKDMQAAGVKLPEPLARGRGRPDLFYARVAALSVAAREHHARSPVKAAAQQNTAGGTPYPRDAIRDFLNVARHQRGLLTKTRPGQAGGRLTAKARRLLEDYE